MTTNGWRKSLWATFGSQFNCPEISDCVILVASGGQGDATGAKLEKFYVHKLVLSLHSPVFGQLMITGDGQKQELDLSSTERKPESFLSFLQCLYDNGTSITPDNVEMMLGFSRKYQVKWLQLRCLNFVARNVSEEEALFLIMSEGF